MVNNTSKRFHARGNEVVPSRLASDSGLVRALEPAVPDQRGWSGAFGLGLVRPTHENSGAKTLDDTRAGVELAAGEVWPHVKMQRNHRRAICFAVPAIACLCAAQPVAGAVRGLTMDSSEPPIVLGVGALAGFVAAEGQPSGYPVSACRIRVQSRPAAHLTVTRPRQRSCTSPAHRQDSGPVSSKMSAFR
jgi:hypothetical protein